jgi:hypothetical protein
MDAGNNGEGKHRMQEGKFRDPNGARVVNLK